jgi:SnoaL-like protein
MWTSRDLERAMTYVADDIVCDAPAGRIEGADAYRAFMGPFVQMLKRAELIAAFGNDTTAVAVYNTDTVPVDNAPGRSASPSRMGRSCRAVSSSIERRSTPPEQPRLRTRIDRPGPRAR